MIYIEKLNCYREIDQTKKVKRKW